MPFQMWYLQCWLAGLTHLTDITKNYVQNRSSIVIICISTILFNLLSFLSLSEDHLHLSPYLSYVSGALAGCAATIGSYPFDLLRTILASQGEPKVRLIYIWSVKLLYFCLNTSGLSGCVIDRRDGKFSVKGIKVLCLVCVFGISAGREFRVFRSCNHYFKPM